MPDAEASRKRQISDRRIPSDLTTQGGGCEFPKLEWRRPDRLYLLILICDGRICGADRAMPPSVFFRPAKLAGLKAGATQAHRLLPGMKIKSSGDAARPLRQIPLQFSHFATKGEIRRESPGGCGRFTPQEFREQRFHRRSRKLSLLSGRIDNGASSIRHESTRSERKTGRVTRDLSANWGLFKTT